MSRKVVYVNPDGKGGWNVKSRGAEKSAGNFENKSRAIGRAKEIAKNAPLGQVVVKKTNGKIQTEYTYGKDPYLPKG
ncbi:MAG TPA: hypothetical protein DCP53_01495 [Elusimicrobia bacterium]|nr:hypothetical protein [Elusimicrobiota bacterium]